MKTQSNEMPTQAFKIEKLNNGKVLVHFYENVQELEQEEVIYMYDRFQIEIDDIPGLESIIESDYDSWIDLAKANEDIIILNDSEKIHELEQKATRTQFENAVQDDMINLTFMATDELYIMIEPLLVDESTPLARTLNLGGNKMAEMYAAMVIRGLKTIEEVPVRYREEVRQILAELEA